MWKVFLTFSLIFVTIILWFLSYYWFFTPVQIFVVETGWEYVVYEEMKWSYNNSSNITNKIYYSLLNEDKIETFKGFWIFYDNPKNVKEEDLRSDVWSILEQKDWGKIPDLELKYKVKQIPRWTYVIAEYPIRWNLSYVLGVFKIYPALEKFSKENKLDNNVSITEIYDIPNEKIIYRQEFIQP